MDSQNNKEEPKLFTFTVPGKPQGKAGREHSTTAGAIK